MGQSIESGHYIPELGDVFTCSSVDLSKLFEGTSFNKTNRNFLVERIESTGDGINPDNIDPHRYHVRCVDDVLSEDSPAVSFVYPPVSGEKLDIQKVDNLESLKDRSLEEKMPALRKLFKWVGCLKYRPDRSAPAGMPEEVFQPHFREKVSRLFIDTLGPLNYEAFLDSLSDVEKRFYNAFILLEKNRTESVKCSGGSLEVVESLLCLKMKDYIRRLINNDPAVQPQALEFFKKYHFSIPARQALSVKGVFSERELIAYGARQFSGGKHFSSAAEGVMREIESAYRQALEINPSR